MSHHPSYAVLTGDIIKSSALSQDDLEEVRKAVHAAVDAMKSWKRGLVKGKPEFFRGDAWQFLLGEAAYGLRAAVFLRASLLTQGIADSRVSIGLGSVRHFSSKRISLSTGEAFVLSGGGLDSMTQYSNLTIQLPKSAGALRQWLPVVAHLCDSLIVQWTERQAEVVCVAIDPKELSHEDIAESLTPSVTKQTITKVLSSANWHAMREAIHLFENTGWETVLKPARE